MWHSRQPRALLHRISRQRVTLFTLHPGIQAHRSGTVIASTPSRQFNQERLGNDLFRTENRMISNLAQRSNSMFSTASHKTSAESNNNGEFPSLLSDEEFEDLKLRRYQGERPEHDQLDNKGIRAKSAPTDGLPESTIEQRFARVSQQLAEMWPSDACASYINGLVISDRAERQGFPQEVIDDLMMLYQINEMRCREIAVNVQRSKGHAATSPYTDLSRAGFH
jgi:hypothetical protein